MIDIAGYGDFSVIGRGGFATVYRARQRSVGRDVAIKVLSDPAPDADLLRRFERESKAVGALSWHPHIAAVVDAGTTDDGKAFIVFELLSGGSLDDRIASTPMPWPDAVAAMIQVADAVEAAHRDDVLHRDIKPANILMNRLGDAKLADFGIASMQDGTKTETGMLATTVSHAAPELFDGAAASRAADVYALGSTLHNLVAGRPPFVPTDGPIAAIIRRIATEPPPRLDPAVVPSSVGNVIAHALAKQPSHRPSSASAFGKALQHAQREAGLPVTPMPVSDATPDSESHQFAAAPSPSVLEPGREWQAATAGSPPPRVTSPAHPPTVSAAAPLGGVASPLDAPVGPQEVDPGVSAQAPATARRPRWPALLASLAVLAAAGVAGVVAFEALRDVEPIATTEGGARIVDISALAETEVATNPGRLAVDRRRDTYWGITSNVEAERNIAGTTFTIRLDQPVNVTAVGIANGESTEFGRVSDVLWGTTIDDLRSGASANIAQQVPDTPGDHVQSFGRVTDRIALLITDVHDIEAATAGIAEILIVVDEP